MVNSATESVVEELIILSFFFFSSFVISTLIHLLHGGYGAGVGMGGGEESGVRTSEERQDPSAAFTSVALFD